MRHLTLVQAIEGDDMAARAAAERWLAERNIQMCTPELRRFVRAWSDVIDRYDEGDPRRDAALLAAARYLAGTLTPVDAGKALLKARLKSDEAMAAARQVAVMAVADGHPEATTARDVGVDRMALRKWLGKR